MRLALCMLRITASVVLTQPSWHLRSKGRLPRPHCCAAGAAQLACLTADAPSLPCTPSCMRPSAHPVDLSCVKGPHAGCSCTYMQQQTARYTRVRGVEVKPAPVEAAEQQREHDRLHDGQLHDDARPVVGRAKHAVQRLRLQQRKLRARALARELAAALGARAESAAALGVLGALGCGSGRPRMHSPSKGTGRGVGARTRAITLHRTGRGEQGDGDALAAPGPAARS